VAGLDAEGGFDFVVCVVDVLGHFFEGEFFERAGETVVAGASVGGGVVADFVALAHHFFPAVDALFHRGQGEVGGAINSLQF